VVRRWKQKRQEGQKRQKDFFVFFALLAFFASSSPPPRKTTYTGGIFLNAKMMVKRKLRSNLQHREKLSFHCVFTDARARLMNLLRIYPHRRG
jgi:hypothetical protein